MKEMPLRPVPESSIRASCNRALRILLAEDNIVNQKVMLGMGILNKLGIPPGCSDQWSGGLAGLETPALRYCQPVRLEKL